MKRWLWIVVLAVVAAGGLWLASKRNAPPESPFARAHRETLVSMLTTNGKTEPVEWSPVHAEREGRVLRVVVERGQTVAAGSVLAELDNNDAQSELAAAQARFEQATVELANLRRGGRAAEIAEIEGQLKRFQVEREPAKREVASLERLVTNQAATRFELDAAKDKLAQLDTQIAAQQARRAALVGQGDIPVAEARVRDAQAAVQLAQRRKEQSVIRTPRGGVVYDLAVKSGAWLGAGDLVAKVGDTSKLRITVYIDEPDLGRIRKGLPVEITWQAEPRGAWKGVVDDVPTQVIALGTRQVGEVVTLADNPNHDLPPGANIDALIRTQVVENAITIPKAALRREGGELGVFVLQADKLTWKKVTVGVSSETKAEVQNGVSDGDSVALPSEKPLAAGMTVTPVYP
ncbi:efflux RND transporter periplasmic adaptor subunit [uncultured Paludibaculum sp.]|uniref:efflux RND transporter periplasmic adaptor subunit n=1 Tax=uncultured Paludibaculum sp. TaxID=1765020 RepID=UPI002AAB89D9|nr:efflux RND transporter periplasmic adaptor subunit [uncultured Paludibaculum sp.]